MRSSTSDQPEARRYLLETVDDVAVVQLYAPGFERLSLDDKRLVWHLYEAALAGRDIYLDQRYRHSLEMRTVIEALVTHADALEPRVAGEALRYAKHFWINNGPFNHITARKFVLRLTRDELDGALRAVAARGATLPPGEPSDAGGGAGADADSDGGADTGFEPTDAAGARRHADDIGALVARMAPLFLDAAVDPSVTLKTPPDGADMLAASANNLYSGVTMADLDTFTERYPLNSRLVKHADGRIVEEVYRRDGKYGPAIARIIGHLEAAVAFASPPMAAALKALIRFYETGAPEDGRAYDIAWVADQTSNVDTINGFIEVYMDPRGQKGAWEALVYYVDHDKTKAIEAIAANAQWFEDHMPWDACYRRPEVTGVTGRAIEVVVETGDAGPVTPIGINLPNDQAVREQFGSKSVLLANVVEAYDKSLPPSFRTEFSWSSDEAARAERWASFAGELTTNMHEIIGHGSGRVAEHLQGNPQGALREQYSTLEETRADLVSLYFLPDDKLVELGLVPAEHRDEIVRAEFEAYARNVLVQLRRIREGTTIEEDHMRNRQAIVQWLIAHDGGIEVRAREGRTYYVVTSVERFRTGVGRLLGEVQRIKSEGDYPAAKALFDQYGTHFDPALRDEIVARVDRLRLPSYTAFVQPRLEPLREPDGTITDVVISYPMDLTAQMLAYSAAYGFAAGRR